MKRPFGVTVLAVLAGYHRSILGNPNLTNVGDLPD